MKPEPQSGVDERFRRVIERRFGLRFEDARLAFLSDIMQQRVAATSNSCAAYLLELEDNPSSTELSALAQPLTVPETYFFRQMEQFQALTELCLPALMQNRASTRQLRLLSAGCASGEEPYSLAILVRDRVPDRSWQVSITGIDLNPAVLARATQARYSNWALRETPAKVVQRWFRAQGREMVLDETIKDAVQFVRRNLVGGLPEHWLPEAYDVVFCRNVLMYFTADAAKELVDHIAHSLVPGGYLFLGHAETLRGISDDFHLCHTHETFYYQRRHRPARPLTQNLAIACSSVPNPTTTPLVAVLQGSDSWVEAIRIASERVRSLTQQNVPETKVAEVKKHPSLRPDLGVALDLLRNERFADALALIDALPPEFARDADALLLQAVLLTHSGALARAEHACAQLIDLDELNAGAHYALALCREGVGDRKGAIEQDQMASYLDPTFAMPRLHLGLLARRNGEIDRARTALEQALSLLLREDASRLLLFGGGFSRKALIALCEAELVACGGSR